MRSFIAVDFDESILSALTELLARLKSRVENLKWVLPDRMHLTIKFLGEIDESRVEPIRRALDELAGACQPFDIALERLGVFPSKGPVNVLWVGIQDPSGGLAACQEQCENLIAPLGFPREDRLFSPHLTLARNRDAGAGRKVRDLLRDFPPVRLGSQRVGHVTLYRSYLGGEKPRYEALSRHEFAAA